MLRLKYTKLARRAGALTFLRMECDHSHLGENNTLCCIGTLWKQESEHCFSLSVPFCCIAKPSLLFFPSAQFHYLLTFTETSPVYFLPALLLFCLIISLPLSDTGPCFSIPLFAFHLGLLCSFATKLD